MGNFYVIEEYKQQISSVCDLHAQIYLIVLRINISENSFKVIAESSVTSKN